MSDETQPELPVDSFREAATHLRRPFEPAAIKFRILEGRNGEDQQKARATCAAYIDARLVGERLNLVCPHLWNHRFEPVPGGMLCHLQVDGLIRSDVGHSENVKTDMGLKALYSDALKRAAVHFGVGVSLYALPGLTLYARDGHVRVWKKDAQSVPKFYLEPKGELELRARYRRWLQDHGAEAFGKPLGHGDVERTTADHEPEAPASDVPATIAPEAPVAGPQNGLIGNPAAADLILNADSAAIPRDDLRKAIQHATGQTWPEDAFEDDERLISVVAAFEAKQQQRVAAWVEKKRAKARA
jgi:hypothetical protein